MTWTWWIVCHRQRERQTLPLGTAAVHLWKRKVRASPGAYHSKCVCVCEKERWCWQITVSAVWHLNTANSDILLFTRRRQQQLVIVFNPCNNNIQQHDVSLICRFCSGGFCGNYVAVVYIRVRNPLCACSGFGLVCTGWWYHWFHTRSVKSVTSEFTVN